MNFICRGVSALLLLLCLIGVRSASAQDASALAVNLAGEQRMLSQRIAKSYAQIGLGVQADVARLQMKEAIARFEANLEKLRVPAQGSVAATRAYERLTDTWTAYRAAATGLVTRDAAWSLSERSLIVLAAADTLTQLLEDIVGSRASRLVNMAGRSRMLSQRLAKAYMLRSWGFNNASVRDELDIAATEFSGRLTLLTAQAQNTPEIRRELEGIAERWDWLQTALAVEGAVSYRLVVADAAEGILAAADRVTRLYEDMAAPATPARR